MSVNLSQKEKMLLQDQKKHEELCIQKYANYANQAQDPKLKEMFNQHGAQEQQHLDTINQILSGQTPNMAQQQGQSNQQKSQNQQTMLSQQEMQNLSSNQVQSQSAMQGVMGNQSDADLCKDLLMTEKFVSSAYDTTIFEVNEAPVRQALNHIQKEEQQHGEQILNYLQNNNMYNLQ